MRLFGLGDLGSTWPANTPEVAACGPSPCTWWDNVYTRDACLNYMQCSIPNDPTTIGMTEGMATGVGATIGQDTEAVGAGLVGGFSPSTFMLIGAAIGLIIVFRK